MPLTGKYLKYSPEITLEIFTLVWDKVEQSGYDLSAGINTIFKNWKTWIYIIIEDNNICTTNRRISNLLETTVQEILGYDPFVNKEVIPEYVECISWFGNSFTPSKIYKVVNGKVKDNDGDHDITDWNHGCFKPSSKPAFDAQNQPKSIEKWSVGSYFVIEKDGLYNISSSKRGDICLIKENENFNFINKKDTTNWSFDLREGSSWFATKSEAEEFAKTLIEPVKHGNGILDAVQVKQPLKQAVHCKTQEEWDFVTEKLGNDGENWFIDPVWGNNKSFCISFEDKNQSQTLDFYQNAGYQILSFQEWCDLNGYKMEKEVKFEVGKWYKMNDCWYLRYKGRDIVATDKIYMSECIDSTFNHKYDNGFVAYLREQKTWRLASIEEIQQYLPDGHPDKIKVDREFKVGDFVISLDKSNNYIVDEFCIISKISKNHLACKNKPQDGWTMKPFRNFRHATPEEVTQHLISIGQIPAGEPLNTGIEPNKDGMFKYKQTMPGASWSGGTIDNHLDVMIPTTGNSYNKDFSTSIIPVKSISAAIEFNYLPEPK